MVAPKHRDLWKSGEAYERYVGRWSRLVAPEFLAWLAVPPGARWLDVGCGAGALTETILKAAAPLEVVGIDSSPGFVAHARERTPDPRARFIVGDARNLSVPSASSDAVVSGLVLNFVPEPATAVAEMTRATSPGGCVAAYVWDYAGGMAMMRRFWDAATALETAAGDLDEGKRFTSICHPEALAGLFGEAGLRQVETRSVDVPARFRDFDDYWMPFLGGQGSAPAYVMSLGAEHRAALRERLRADLPTAADGSISLTARAWAVRGER